MLAGRPGSWEADGLRQLITSTVGQDEQDLLAHRTEPVVVEVYVSEILNDLGVWGQYDEAAEVLAIRAQAVDPTAPDQEQMLNEIGPTLSYAQSPPEHPQDSHPFGQPTGCWLVHNHPSEETASPDRRGVRSFSRVTALIGRGCVVVSEDLKAVARAAGRLANKRARKANPALVEYVFCYGAVDIDPSHLVVWVLLKGPQGNLPRWFFPSGHRATDEASACGLLHELYHLAGVVRQAFEDAGWPRSEVQVGFDSDERVGGEGGWHYFK